MKTEVAAGLMITGAFAGNSVKMGKQTRLIKSDCVVHHSKIVDGREHVISTCTETVKIRSTAHEKEAEEK